MSCLFAATYPERAWALVLYGGKARDLRAPDYPWGPTEAEALRAIAEERAASDPTALAEEMAQSGMPTASAAEVAALTRMYRQSASPGALETLSAAGQAAASPEDSCPNTSTRFRPCRLATYIALSAFRSTSSGWSS
jgi:hypothetical protein